MLPSVKNTKSIDVDIINCEPKHEAFGGHALREIAYVDDFHVCYNCAGANERRSSLSMLQVKKKKVALLLCKIKKILKMNWKSKCCYM